MEQTRATYQYLCRNKDGRLTPYSVNYTNRNKACEWYLKYGILLERMFDRKLLLSETIWELSEFSKHLKEFNVYEKSNDKYYNESS